MKKNFDVTGMTCSACSNRVEKAVSHVPGVEDVNVNLLKNSMTVDYDETKTGLEQIIQAVTDAGYGASEKQAAGSLIGGTLQSIGQVIASAVMVNKEVVEFATIFKIVRIIFIVFIALSYSRMNLEEGKPLFTKNTQITSKIKAGIPWFVVGFFIFSVLNSTGIIPTIVSTTAKSISSQFEIIALAAIGMRVKFRDLVKEGPKAILYGGLTGGAQIAFAIVFIAIMFA